MKLNQARHLHHTAEHQSRLLIAAPWGTFLLALTMLAAVFLFSGCTTTSTVSADTRQAIYQRADVHFELTVLDKPEGVADPEFELAPLLLQQVTDTNTPPPIPSTVYFWRTATRLNGETLAQFNYLWFYPQGDENLRVPQGVRITFNGQGHPVVWEILRDDTGVRLLFVSQSLEAAAMKRYPAPLPGRRFWVERAVEQTPDLVVARIIDDSATPMGPILYLKSGSHDVSTLICRCMDAQAKELLGMKTYGLAELDDAAVRWLNAHHSKALMRWLPGRPADQLEQWLRVPAQPSAAKPDAS